MYLAVADDGRVLAHANFPGPAEMAAMRTHASSTFGLMEADRQVVAAIELGKVPTSVVSDDGYASVDPRDQRYSVFEFAVTETVFGVFLGAADHVDAKAAAMDILDRLKVEQGGGRRETVLSVVGYPADFNHGEVFESVARGDEIMSHGFWKVRPGREDLIVIRSITLRMADFDETDEAEAIARDGDDDERLRRREGHGHEDYIVPDSRGLGSVIDGYLLRAKRGEPLAIETLRSYAVEGIKQLRARRESGRG